MGKRFDGSLLPRWDNCDRKCLAIDLLLVGQDHGLTRQCCEELANSFVDVRAV